MNLLTAIINTTGTIAVVSVSLFAGWQANSLYTRQVEPVVQSASFLASVFGGK